MRILIVALFFLVAGSVSAQDNQFSFYFDEGASITATTATVGEAVTAYLVITDLDFSGGVAYWEASGIGVANIASPSRYPSGDPFPITHSVRGGGVDVGSGPCESLLFFGDLENLWCPEVFFSEPLMVSGSVVLAELQVEVPNVGDLGVYDSAYLGVQMSDDTWHYLAPATTPLSTMPPLDGTLCATINSDFQPVGVVETSWSGVKALYR